MKNKAITILPLNLPAFTLSKLEKTKSIKMKKIFSVLLGLVFTLSFAQIKITQYSNQNLVGEINSFSENLIKLYKHNNQYTFVFYGHVTGKGYTNNISFYFDDTDGETLDAFYTTIMDGFNKSTDTYTVIEFTDCKVSLEYYSDFFNYKVKFVKQDKIPMLDGSTLYSNIKYSSYTFTKKQIKKLFGKN